MAYQLYIITGKTGSQSIDDADVLLVKDVTQASGVTTAEMEAYVGGELSVLTTDEIPEGVSGNRIYHTAARVLATVLTGLGTPFGVVTSADTILQAIGKLQRQITDHIASAANYMTYPIYTIGTTSISFDQPRIYGHYDTPLTGSVSFNFTTPKQITQRLFHQAATKPTGLNSAKTLQGEYVPNTLNEIHLTYDVNSDLSGYMHTARYFQPNMPKFRYVGGSPLAVNATVASTLTIIHAIPIPVGSFLNANRAYLRISGALQRLGGGSGAFSLHLSTSPTSFIGTAGDSPGDNNYRIANLIASGSAVGLGYFRDFTIDGNTIEGLNFDVVAQDDRTSYFGSSPSSKTWWNNSVNQWILVAGTPSTTTMNLFAPQVFAMQQ